MKKLDSITRACVLIAACFAVVASPILASEILSKSFKFRSDVTLDLKTYLAEREEAGS